MTLYLRKDRRVSRDCRKLETTERVVRVTLLLPTIFILASLVALKQLEMNDTQSNVTIHLHTGCSVKHCNGIFFFFFLLIGDWSRDKAETTTDQTIKALDKIRNGEIARPSCPPRWRTTRRSGAERGMGMGWILLRLFVDNKIVQRSCATDWQRRRSEQ